MQPSKVPAVEYPRDPSKDEPYASVDYHKALAVADAVLGARPPAARARFGEQLLAAAAPADDADVERLRRERREAAAKDGGGGAGGAGGAGGGGADDLPERFFKLPRIRFLLLLCREVARINRFLARHADDKFSSLDASHSGRVPAAAAKAFARAAVAAAACSGGGGGGDAQAAEAAAAQFLAAAEAHERDAAASEAGGGGAVAAGATGAAAAAAAAAAAGGDLTREAFAAAVRGAPAVRNAIKAALLPPALLEAEEDEAQGLSKLLDVTAARHYTALGPFWARCPPLDSSGNGGGGAGDARFRAYCSLILGLISFGCKSFMDSAAATADDVEQRLCRLEDAALVFLQGVPCLLAEPSAALAGARLARSARGARAAEVSQRLALYHRLRLAVEGSAAGVLQAAWRRWARRQQQERRAAGDDDGDEEAAADEDADDDAAAAAGGGDDAASMGANDGDVIEA